MEEALQKSEKQSSLNEPLAVNGPKPQNSPAQEST